MFKKVVCGLVAVGLTLGNTASFAQVQTGAQAVRMTPRQAMYHYAKTGNLKGLQSLRSRGYSIDLNDAKGNSALCEATWRADKVAVASLLKAGANTNAQCMQKIPAQYKQAVGLNSAPTYASAGSTAGTGATASSAAGAAATGLSTGAMVGIGVGAAALIGGGIALAASGGGGSKSSSTPVPPVDLCANINCDQPNQRCEAGQCICDDGFKMFDGTCYATISCGAHGTQNKDSCVCEAGYAGADCSTCAADYILQNGVCYAKLSCPANASQQADSCVCDSGYDKYGTSECHETLTCDAHSHQQADSCVCNDGYVMQGGVCTFDSCPANQYQNGEECLACPANSTSVAGSTSISQCVCDAGYTKTPSGMCMNETADVAGYGYTFIAEPTSANGVYNIKDTGYKVFSNTKDLTYSYSGGGFPTYSENGKSVELQTIMRADTQGAQINNKGTITSSLDTNLISVRNGAVAVNYGTLRSTQKGTSETLITAAMYADRTSSLYNYGDIYMNRGIGMFVRGFWTQSDKDPNFKQASEVNVVNTKNISLNPDSNSALYGAVYGIFVDLARDPSYKKSVSINIENSGTITANGGIYLYDNDTIDPEEKFGKDVLPHELNISILNTGSITAETGSGIATFEVGSRFLDYGSHIEVVNGQCYDPVMGYVRECPYKDGQSSIKILDNNYATLDNIKMKVTNEGTITAAKQGISAPGTIVNKGTIKSSLAGIRAVQETTRIENYKDIIAATTGISAFGDKELEILNEGTIMAGNFDESVLEDNRANGILANAIKSIINKGQITSKGTGIDMNAISLLNSGTINAQEYGVKFSGTSFTNSGVIDSQTRGVSTVGDFFNTSTGKIYGRNGEGVLASGFVKNEGEIHGGTTGISIGGSSTEFSKLVNMGDIYATNTGLYAKHAIVENYGTITVSEAKGLGISIVDSGKVNFTNEKGGVIGLTSSGIGIRITAFNAEDVINIKNEGSINTTDGTAIKAYDVISAATVSIINNGDIASLKGRGIEGKYLKVKNEEKGFIRGTISQEVMQKLSATLSTIRSY